MSYLLPHLHSGWAVDQAILAEEERLVLIRFGHDWDETCMQRANLLFLEAPFGVGFSFTNTSSDLEELSDEITATNSHSSNRTSSTFLERAMQIGNALLDDDTDGWGMVDCAWGHALISDEVYYNIKKYCNFSSDEENKPCDDWVERYYDVYGLINMYSLYAPLCFDDSGSARKRPMIDGFRPKFFSKHNKWHQMPAGYDPCVSDYTKVYLNRPDVQKALHANVTRMNYNWTHCSDVIQNWADSPFTMLPTIRKLIDGGLRVWVYSGDTDGRIPVTSARYTLQKLGLKTKQAWTPWYTSKEVGGWTIDYAGLTFGTIRGAGHQVPQFKPKHARQLVRQFLANQEMHASQALLAGILVCVASLVKLFSSLNSKKMGGK